MTGWKIWDIIEKKNLMEKWIDGKKKFCSVEKKNAMTIENVVYINLFSLKKLIVYFFLIVVSIKNK